MKDKHTKDSKVFLSNTSNWMFIECVNKNELFKWLTKEKEMIELLLIFHFDTQIRPSNVISKCVND